MVQFILHFGKRRYKSNIKSTVMVQYITMGFMEFKVWFKHINKSFKTNF